MNANAEFDPARKNLATDLTSHLDALTPSSRNLAHQMMHAAWTETFKATGSNDSAKAAARKTAEDFVGFPAAV